MSRIYYLLFCHSIHHLISLTGLDATRRTRYIFSILCKFFDLQIYQVSELSTELKCPTICCKSGSYQSVEWYFELILSNRATNY